VLTFNNKGSSLVSVRALFNFTKKILDGDMIDVNNNGDIFIHVDDIVECDVRIADVVHEYNEHWTVEQVTPA
jgi:UDP-glucuronate 4-epimerase